MSEYIIPWHGYIYIVITFFSIISSFSKFINMKQLRTCNLLQKPKIQRDVSKLVYIWEQLVKLRKFWRFRNCRNVDYKVGDPPRFAVNNSERHTCLVWHLKGCVPHFIIILNILFRKSVAAPILKWKLFKTNGWCRLLIWIINTHN